MKWPLSLLFFLGSCFLCEGQPVQTWEGRPVDSPAFYCERLTLFEDSTFSFETNLGTDLSNFYGTCLLGAPWVFSRYVGTWHSRPAIDSNQLTLEVERNWCYLAEEHYDSTISKGWVHVFLIAQDETLGPRQIFYQINETGPAFQVDIGSRAGNRVNPQPIGFAGDCADYQLISRKLPSPTKPVIVDSITVEWSNSWFDYYIPTDHQTFYPSCKDCNLFIFKSKYRYLPYTELCADDCEIPPFSGGKCTVKGDTLIMEGARLSKLVLTK